MKVNYIFGIALSVSSVLFMSSCSEDIMDKINKDEQHPSTGVVDGRLQITDAEVATVYSVLCGSYAWYVSSYTEQLFGTGNGQLKDVEIRRLSEMSASTSFDNEWNSTYLNLNNLVVIKSKCAEGGVNADQYDLLGMEQTLEALNWGTLTDLHGDISCSQCFGDISAPKIDKQDIIYNHIFELLDSAQINFAKGGDNVGSHDLLFSGDLSKWEGLAHALKARYLLHTYGRNKAVLNTVIKEANEAIAAGFTGCNLDIFNGNGADNSWSAYFWSREYIGSSKTVDDLLLDRKDPREPIYNLKYKYGKNVPITDAVGIPGNKDQAEETEAINIPAWLNNGAAYLHVFSKSELYFILAECKARLGLDAKADFETAVTASIDDYFDTGGSVAGVKLTDTTISDYLVSLKDRYGANPLKEIMIQKYIAQTRDEQLETYNDMRRCRYTDGSYYVKMTNPNNTVNGSNCWPLRLPYGNSDVVSNPNVKAAFGTGNSAGAYVFTEPVWWAGGQR